MVGIWPPLAGACALALAAVARGEANLTSPEVISIEIDKTSGRHGVASSRHGLLGSDGTIRGAGGYGYMEVARSAGADALRTWGVGGLGGVLEKAEAHGLRVSAGLWLPHSPSFYEHCSDMEADPRWRAELERYIEAVRTHKNSTGLLWWTVGNEEELEVNVLEGNECVWKRLEWAVQAVKAEDPHHPVGTVLAGVAVGKVLGIIEYAPSLDFLGVNAYGDESLEVGGLLLEWNWTKPYAIMEFGPSGHWASPVTEFGSYVEESSSQKLPRYNATCYTCLEDPLCIGSFAFVWGWKWEKTGTWYNMFNEWTAVTEGVAVDCPRCQSEVMDALQTCWTGSHRQNRPPSISGVEVDGEILPDMSFIIDRRDEVEIKVHAEHPQGRDLVAIWAATEEVVSNAIGGAYEATNPLLPGLWPAQVDAQSSTSNGHAAHEKTTAGISVSMNTSGLIVDGVYRLYVFVRQDPDSCDGPCPNQEASASLPFRICHTSKPGELCYRHVKYGMDIGIHELPQKYPGVDADSSFDEFQMMLHQLGLASCPAPCGVRAWCHTSVPGEECYGQVRWLMDHGMPDTPDAYPEALHNATFEAVQAYINGRQDGVCPRPCDVEALADDDSGAGGRSENEQSAACGSHLRAALAAVLAGVASLAW